ncbi:MAG: shikimate dehydrogenase [Bacteroidales bacterium]|nr:shikimate dehydrogenase [Bacteroidales bacterium]
MRRYGLIGYPLGHSFSASYFREKFHQEGIDADYRNFPLEQLADFKELLHREPGLSGLNVTVPYKQEIIPFLDTLSPTSESVRAVNTISFRKNRGGMELIGDNTDVTGFRQSLEEYLKPHHTRALVLGTGGSSKAVIYVLEQLGIGCTLVSRTSGKACITYRELDEERVAATPLIVNTTPLGMHPGPETYPDIPYRALSPEHLLFDLVYNPARTLFLIKGEKQGARIVNGHQMLIFQAEASWKIWNGIA